ncbi:MAG TPA: SGNH/GDSL hydrolase family protein [Caulifigura sp.]|nr:SGNH/GDSL hydrolase family protein [Caulifigura sp.]
MQLSHLRPALLSLIIATLFAGSALAQPEGTSTAPAELRLHHFPNRDSFRVQGLAWFNENSPQLWRMPVREMNSLPKGVQNRSRCPSGARIVFRSNTTKLAIRLESSDSAAVKAVDAFIDGQPGESSFTRRTDQQAELLLFDHQKAAAKDITIYLPHGQEVIVTALGLDSGATIEPVQHTFARPLPVVYYGSSVCQGSGAVHPGQTYPAILSRELNLDFINLGFGGAGKAEPNVVALVNSIHASGYVFDLGKSYGDQDATAFRNMLQTVRASHPETPIVVITPITSIKETNERDYSKRSVHTRTVMRDPVNELIQAGDKRLFLVEGEDLLGFQDHALLSKDGVHPSDTGYALIASRLAPTLKSALGL